MVRRERALVARTHRFVRVEDIAIARRCCTCVVRLMAQPTRQIGLLVFHNVPLGQICRIVEHVVGVVVLMLMAATSVQSVISCFYAVLGYPSKILEVPIVAIEGSRVQFRQIEHLMLLI